MHVCPTKDRELDSEARITITRLNLIIVLTLFSSGCNLLRDPHHNKGLAFTEKERDAHYLRGLLPPSVISQDLQVLFDHQPLIIAEFLNRYRVISNYLPSKCQVKKMLNNIRQYQVPLQRYMAMMDLQVPMTCFSF